MRLAWTPAGWETYRYWQTADRRMLKRINSLIDDVMRSPYEGIGKPEALKYRGDGAWSRRITDEHRLVYRIDGDDLVIMSTRYHYDA